MANSLIASFIQPETLLKQLTISAGISVADFGCGSGYFSLAFARAVGKEGHVYALDILPSALEAVASHAKIENLPQLSVKRANLEKENGSGLPPESIDFVVLKDILFQNNNKEVVLHEVRRILRSGGQALLVEWNTKDASVGPEIKLRFPKEALLQLIANTGFTVKRELEAGEFHDAFLLVK
jgi:ubiquinone/menaquinone biosynthesis C-methylase UbiE